MTGIQQFALAGIGLNLVGVLMLFRYGMPFRVETKGVSVRTISDVDNSAIRAERHYRALGNVGLLLILAGSALQALAVLLT